MTTSPFELTGKVAVVTGASRGIGAATAQMFAAAGAHVVLVARGEDALAEVAGRIEEAGGTSTVAATDLADPEAAVALVRRVRDDHGGPHVLAAFAGGSTGRPKPIEDLTDDDWSAALDANLTTTFRTVRAVVPAMVEQGSGSIVTMASSASQGAVVAPAAYAAAKAGIGALTRQLALQVAPSGVRVNCLAPSTIRTERLARVPAERLEAIAAEHPLARLGTPEDVANAALFLAADASGWITGITLDVAGGLLM